MKTRHTAGEWTALQRGDDCGKWSRRWWIQGPSDDDGDGARNIAEVSDLKSAERQAANARLIAASPILFAYVNSKAQSGDADAIRIISQINA
jgi:hypothetical protein